MSCGYEDLWWIPAFKYICCLILFSSFLQWESEAVRTWGCEDVRLWGREAVRTWGCEDVRLWGREAVRTWGCEDVRLWGHEAVRTWGCEDMRLWGREAVRTWGCEDVRLWGFEDVRLIFNSATICVHYRYTVKSCLIDDQIQATELYHTKVTTLKTTTLPKQFQVNFISCTVWPDGGI